MFAPTQKFRTLIAHDESDKILFNFRKRILQHLKRVAADSVHLRVKLETRNTVADIDQRSTRVFLDNVFLIFDRLEDQNPWRIAERNVFARREIKVKLLRVLFFVEGSGANSQHLFDVRGNRHPLFFHPRHRLLDADRIPNFKRPQLPAKTPAHRAIDFDYVVRDFGNAFGCVRERA